MEKTRLGIPIIAFDEALHGLVRDGATVFPQAIGLAATWDTALMGRVALAIARETRSRGIRQALSPVLNVARDVRWGRVEETYGEDPFLSSMMGRAFVSSFERHGVIATPKHFVANVGDGGRDSYPIEYSDRLLEEVFLPPFQWAIREGGARSVMTAYNSIDGSPATQNRALLTDKLRRDWGFAGFVISDAAATGGATVLHHTEASTATAVTHALDAGLDVVFQSTWEQHQPYLDAFQRGLIADSVIDAAVGRVLRAKFELGLFERPYAIPDSAEFWNGHAAHRALAREAAHASIVLLKNEGGRLPLSRAIPSVAVIGLDADSARLGGYSGPGGRTTSILSAVRSSVGASTRVRYAPGPGRIAREYTVVGADRLARQHDGRLVRGLLGEYFANNTLSGTPAVTRTDDRIDFGWTLNSPARGIPFDWYSVRWTGTLTGPPGGATQLGIQGNDGYRVYLDGRMLIDNWSKRSFDTRVAPVAIRAGSVHDLRVEYFESTGNARVKLVWDAPPRDPWRERIDSAVAIARTSAVAVIVAGIEEGEFRDRASLSLPGHQEQLISRVAATGTPVVVVLVGGSATTMSHWIGRVPAVLTAWYPGEEGGSAVADVLFGAYNPAGRLPITFPVSEGQLPLYYNHKPTGRGDDYLDLTGQPLFPFGHGLSYTHFAYANLTLDPAHIGPTQATTASFTLTNDGARDGDEVVQLYVHQVLASVAQPVIALKDFARVHLRAGESRTMTFRVGPEALRMLDRAMRPVVEPGTFRLLIGASSKDIRLRGELGVQ